MVAHFSMSQRQNPLNISPQLLLSLPRLLFLPFSKTKNPSPKSFQPSSPTTTPQTTQTPSQHIPDQDQKAVGFDGAYLTPPIESSHTNNNSFIKRVPGFYNAGNTCYLASILQSLLHSPNFVNAVLSATHPCPTSLNNRKRFLNNGFTQGFCTFCEIKRLVESIHNINNNNNNNMKGLNERAIAIGGFAKNVHSMNRRFRRGSQQDAHEAIMGIFSNLMRNSIFGCRFPKMVSTKIEQEFGTLVHAVFGNCLKSVIICWDCKKRSVSYQGNIDISIDILKSSSVMEGLISYFRNEKLVGKNQYRCEGCNKLRNAIKKTFLRRAPNELMVQLKRFVGMRKNCKSVKVDMELDLGRFVDREGIDKGVWEDLRGEFKYELCSVVVHRGRMLSAGHYYAYVKEGGQWFRKDDATTTKVSPAVVQRDEAYLVFYTRKESGMTRENGKGPMVSEQSKRNNVVGSAGSISNSQRETPSWLGKNMEHKKSKQKKRFKVKNMLKGNNMTQVNDSMFWSTRQQTPKLHKRKRVNDWYDRELDQGRMKKIRRRK